MFQGIAGITIDKTNRVFTSEIFPGRVQQFLYVTDAQADQLNKEKEAAREKKAGSPAVPPSPLTRASAPTPK